MTNEAHIRIDEGIKRGPKKRYNHRPPMKRNESGQFLEAIPEGLDPDKVLDMYLAYPKTSQIAKELGIRRSTLVWWLREQRPEQWKKVQVIRALVKKEDGDENIEEAADALMLARAREQLRSGQWDLERLDSANYGPKQEVTVHSQPILNISIIAPQQPKLINEVQTNAVQQPVPVLNKPDNT